MMDGIVRLIGVLDNYRLAVDENIGATAEK